MKNASSTILIVAMFAGCASEYIPPAGPDTAILKIQNNSDHPLLARSYSIAEDCSGEQFFIIKGQLQPKETAFIKINANQKFSFFVSYVNPGVHISKYTVQPVTFLPKTNETYDFVFWSDGEKYSVRMSMNQDGKTIPEPSFQIREYQQPFTDSGSFCKVFK